jgi:hypothetical protein
MSALALIAMKGISQSRLISRRNIGGASLIDVRPAPKLLLQVERLAQLPKAQQRVVMQMLDGVLAQAGRQE